MRRLFNSPFVAGLGLPALLGRTAKLRVKKELRAGTHRLRRLFGLIDNVSISAKAFAASFVLLCCLIGLGTNAYLSLDRAATGLADLSKVHLPKQRTASDLTRDVITTHLKIFRFVTWAQIGVGVNTLETTSSEVLAELETLRNRLQLLRTQPHLSPAEIERVATLLAKWNQYAREIDGVMAAAASDAPMASMLLGATDDEFQSIVAQLQEIAALVANQTSATSHDLTTSTEWSRHLLALGGAFGVVISVLVTLFVGRSIVAPIRAITRAMQDVSSGHGRIDVGYRNRRDEIGQMVEAIAVFQQTMERQNKLLADRQDELRAQNLRFDAAVNNMPQGLAMFDAEQRLVVCNRLYADLYGLTPTQVKSGTTIRQLLEYRHAKGVFGNVDFEAFVHNWLSEFSEASSRIQELSDGRVISIVRRPIAGGGLVSTTEDITERQKLNERLEQQHDLLKQQEEKLRAKNLQLDAALGNMVQGLAMFDAEQRIVIANARYAEMYGLTPEQVKPGTTFREILQHRIRSGQYGDKSLDEVLAGIRRHAPEKISGDYLSELADGRCIAVSVQRMADGGSVTTHQDITEQRRSEAKIAHMALHDSLTGLANRALLNERLDHAIARANGGEIVAAHLIDLDLFKNVNDTLGHAAGDKLLTLVTSRLRRLVRETDTIARMGGDEFAIVQIAIAGPADATSLAHRIVEAVSAPYEIEGHQVVIGASVGIAVGPDDGLTHHELMRNADLALYRAKADGRGTFRFFEPAMDAQVQARRALENDLRKALPAGEFELYYQPVVDLASNDVCGFEALIRWHHPNKGMVAPNTFIPLAEEIGLIIPLGEWVIREACATAARWPDDLKVAVNLSPAQFRSPGLVQVIFNALATSALAPERLELEITETVLLQDSEATLATLYSLRELGVRIAMDDFGTGYSSLSYLQSFPFDKIKIDRSFIKDITESAGSLNIVRAVAALAKGLGMTTTAEGVETKEQLDTIAMEGCTEMQGFLFSRPLPPQEIERLFLSGRRQATVRPSAAAG